MERHRAISLLLEERLRGSTPSTRVLHFAPEPPITQRLVASGPLDVVTADLVDPTAMVQADLMDLPFADDEFDIIICSHVLEHVPDDARALQEMRRVLRPDGWVLLAVPIFLDRDTTDEDPTVADPQERLRRFGQVDHVRAYGRDFPTRVGAQGFDVEVCSIGSAFTAQQVSAHALQAHRDVYIARPA